MFVCDQCGECCRHLGHYAFNKDLDRGDGVCRYLDGNLCRIYDDRPFICRVDEMYDVYFKDTMTRDEYDHFTYKSC
jgi:Fe-S-cluster containining protein